MVVLNRDTRSPSPTDVLLSLSGESSEAVVPEGKRALRPGRPLQKAAELIQTTWLARKWLGRARKRAGIVPIPTGTTRVEAPKKSKWSQVQQAQHMSLGEKLGILAPVSLSGIARENGAREKMPHSKEAFVDKGESSNYWDQADETMHTEVAWRLRLKLRSHPLIVGELERCSWLIIPKDSDKNADLKVYTKLQMSIYKALVEPMDEKDARKCAKSDWSKDCKGQPDMNREAAMDSFFEMADMWTRSIDPTEYWAFLRKLFNSIASGEPPRLIPLDQIQPCRSLIDEEDDGGESARAMLAAEEAVVRRPKKAEEEVAVAQKAAEIDRLADLRRRQAAGELTPEELAELQALEEKEAEERLADLKRRQAAGLLTPEELEEMKALEREARKKQRKRDAEARRPTMGDFLNGSLLEELSPRAAAEAAALSMVTLLPRPRLRHQQGQHKKWSWTDEPSSRPTTSIASARGLSSRGGDGMSDGEFGGAVTDLEEDPELIKVYKEEALNEVLFGVMAGLDTSFPPTRPATTHASTRPVTSHTNAFNPSYPNTRPTTSHAAATAHASAKAHAAAAVHAAAAAHAAAPGSQVLPAHAVASGSLPASPPFSPGDYVAGALPSPPLMGLSMTRKSPTMMLPSTPASARPLSPIDQFSPSFVKKTTPFTSMRPRPSASTGNSPRLYTPATPASTVPPSSNSSQYVSQLPSRLPAPEVSSAHLSTPFSRAVSHPRRLPPASPRVGYVRIPARPYAGLPRAALTPRTRGMLLAPRDEWEMIY